MKLFLQFLILLYSLIYQSNAVAGPFMASAKFSQQSSKSITQYSTQPTTKHVIDFSKNSSGYTQNSSVQTYKNSTQSTAHYSAEVLDDSSNATKKSGIKVSKASTASSDKSVKTSQRSGNTTRLTAKYTYNEVGKPTTRFSHDIADVTGDVSRKSSLATKHSSEAVYQKAIKPSSNVTSQSAQFSNEKVLKASSKITLKSADHSLYVIDSAKLSSQHSSHVSHEELIQPSFNLSNSSLIASDKSLRSSYNASLAPTVNGSVKASKFTTVASKESPSYTTKHVIKPVVQGTAAGSHASSYATGVTVEHVIVPAANGSIIVTGVAIEGSDYSSEFPEQSVAKTDDYTLRPTTKGLEEGTRVSTLGSDKTSDVSSQGSKVMVQKVSEPSLESSSEITGKSADVSVKVGKVSAETGRSSSNNIAYSSKNASDVISKVSLKLDASLEATSKLSNKQETFFQIDPDVADQLLRESYQFNGQVLDAFSSRLGVSKTLLAQTIVSTVPMQPSHKQLINMMSFVLPELKNKYQAGS